MGSVQEFPDEGFRSMRGWCNSDASYQKLNEIVKITIVERGIAVIEKYNQ